MIPCDSIATMGSVGFVASRTTDRLVLGVPELEAEPIEVRTKNDGFAAMYAHKVENDSSLMYLPNPKNFGGWPFSSTVNQRPYRDPHAHEGQPRSTRAHARIIQRLTADVS